MYGGIMFQDEALMTTPKNLLFQPRDIKEYSTSSKFSIQISNMK